MNPRFSLIAQTFGDAMRLARREAYARLRDARPDAQQPLPLEPVPTLVTAALARVPGDAAEVADAAASATERYVRGDVSGDPSGDPHDDAQADLDLAYEPDEGPLTEMPEIDDSDVDDSAGLWSLAMLSGAGLKPTPVRIPDHERRAYENRSIPWPRPSLSWAAGMLDGDGCVAIVKQTYPNRASTYRLVVQVTQNCLQTLKHFRVCVGVPGTIHEVKRRIGHNRQVYALHYAGPKAVLVLQRLAAHLVRKRPEAEVALSFIEKGQVGRRFGPRGVPPAIEQIRISHYNKLRALK
ncbi:hypothetical protein JNX00_20575 [Hydrogenophaga sp. YM1]|uniref:hypothetical protein n=1 Tax=Hydrogenophaga sp. YM1 TaxID=2806262 RepID=UPI00195E2990|nr:hypothetical protein [Hydrogenophaga sp. YM1]QRR33993.1 hypothetical protein JNX00_20575 [Hydrogenophaga sp. YM1]